MELLEKSLKLLLHECEAVLKPKTVVSSKWITSKDSHPTVRQVKNIQKALLLSFLGAYSKILELESYKSCQLAFEKDIVFRDASKLAGRRGTFDVVFQDIIQECGRIRRNKVILARLYEIISVRSLRLRAIKA